MNRKRRLTPEGVTMPSPMNFGRPGRAPEPLAGERPFAECRAGKHAACSRLDMDDWNRFLECTCACHQEEPRRSKGK